MIKIWKSKFVHFHSSIKNFKLPIPEFKLDKLNINPQ